MRLAYIIVVGTALLAVALLSRAPASLVSPTIGRLTEDRLTMVDPQGTLWHGRALLSAGEERMPVAWRVHAASLLRGEVAVTLTPGTEGASTPRGEIMARDHAMHIRDFSIELPAAVLVAAAIPRPRLDARGVIDVTASALDWPPTPNSGSVRATWHDAAIGLAGNEPVVLGDVSARLVARNGELTGPLDNLGGDLAIDGNLTIRADGSGAVSGIVRTRKPDDPRYAALLSIGVREAGGVRVEWQWPGR
ncbi:MAG TPA: type II secretion system protein N [Casimicrobiaceae bacterium]|nr:type II secretion system protein N [Casimicrobiaceae bacterium]